MSIPNYISSPHVDHGPELASPPWPRHDDPKQTYTDTSADTPPSHYTKPEHNYGSSYEQPPNHQSPNEQTPIPQSASSKGKKALFGLGIIGWSVLLVALTAIIVGAAVGGGVGSALSSCNSDKSSLNNQLASCSTPSESTSTGSSESPSVSVSIVTATVTLSSSPASGTSVVTPIDLSNFTVVDPATIADIYTGCPGLDKTTYTSTRGDDYTIHCDTNSGYGSPTLEDPNLTLQVFAGFVSYSLDDCMEACSAFNAFSNRNNLPEMRCRSITFDHKLSTAIATNQYVNCWIKVSSLHNICLVPSGCLSSYHPTTSLGG